MSEIIYGNYVRCSNCLEPAISFEFVQRARNGRARFVYACGAYMEVEPHRVATGRSCQGARREVLPPASTRMWSFGMKKDYGWRNLKPAGGYLQALPVVSPEILERVEMESGIVSEMAGSIS